MKTISIAKDFSDVPWGRYPSDGPYCGQNFRERLLTPALRSNEKVVVLLDDVEGYGSSFLEEAFGGLVHKDSFATSELEKKLMIVAHGPKYQLDRDIAWRYIKEAGDRLAAA